MSTKGHAEPLAMWTMAGRATLDLGLASGCICECYSVFARDCAAVISYASPAENDRCQATLICKPSRRFWNGSLRSSIAKNVTAMDPRRAAMAAGSALYPVRYPFDETDLVVSIP
jgi:hypothetical protein